MSKDRFKIGDRVVVASLPGDLTYYKVGDFGIVVTEGRLLDVKFDASASYPGRWLVDSDWLELESVYNSPLYRALR